MTAFNYLIIASVCLSVFYLTYLLVFRQSTQFKQMRYFLTFSMVIACILPFNRFQVGTIYMTKTDVSKLTEFIETSDFEPSKFEIQNDESSQIASLNQPTTIQPQMEIEAEPIKWVSLLWYVYLCVTILLLIRILLQILVAVRLYFDNSKYKDGNFCIINLHKQNTHFTLFRWIFINKEICTSDAYNQVLKHEKIHAQQYHSFDVLMIELLSAVMWFNPFVWMLRKSLKLVHEFLADEGVLSAGVSKFQYQQLLINQVAETSLVGFSSSFNSSTIKKRMKIMNATQEKKSKHYLWLLIPIGTVLSLSISLLNAQNSGIKTSNAENQPSVVVTDSALSDNTNIDILLIAKSKKNKGSVSFAPRNGSTFNEGMKNVLKNKSYTLYIAIYADIKSDNQIVMNSPDYILANADSEQLTKLLNSKFKTATGLVSDTVIWAKIYKSNDKTMPVVLKIGYNQKRIPKNLSSPVVQKIINTLEVCYEESNSILKRSSLSQLIMNKSAMNKENDAQTLLVQMDKMSFADGLKSAIEKKSSLYVAVYGNISSESQISVDLSDYILCKEDGDRLTKILNNKYKTSNNSPAESLAWAKFYVSKNDNSPVILSIGLKQKKLPHNGADPVLRKISEALSQFYNS